ncbi:MAG: RecB family exonuclease [Mycobacteriales bacterium]
MTSLDAPVVGSLSPSRASDFMSCPLKYRFRVLDRLPEPPSPEASRGTLVHSVLEQLFELPANARTPDAATALLPAAWESLQATEPEVAELFPDPAALEEWLASARALLGSYFTLEDPRLLEPAAREERVEVVLDGGLALRGIIDRLDQSASGELRIVDYKTGAAPRPGFEGAALFQMKFYALVLWRTRGVIPRVLTLLYLKDRQALRYEPTEADLCATERKVKALWAAIDQATRTGDFRPRPSRLCDWCAHQRLCPAFGGTPPPLPAAPAILGGDGTADPLKETKHA